MKRTEDISSSMRLQCTGKSDRVCGLQTNNFINKMMTQSRFQKGPMPWERTPNMLLTKSELGKSKPTVRDLPPDEYVYGQRVPYGPEDSNQGTKFSNPVMYNWKYHEPTSMEIK
jgi:hypothetical protein